MATPLAVPAPRPMDVGRWLTSGLSQSKSSPLAGQGWRPGPPAFEACLHLISPLQCVGRDCGHPLLPFLPVPDHGLDAVLGDARSLPYLSHESVQNPSVRVSLATESSVAPPSQNIANPLFYSAHDTVDTPRSSTAQSNAVSDEMTSTISPPYSPPDLSETKSSKSSSAHSSFHFSQPDGIVSEISNFEEIGLEDEKNIPILEVSVGDGCTLGKRPATRPIPAPTRKGPATVSGRDLTSMKIPGYPSLHSQVKNAVHSRPLDGPHVSRSDGPMRREFTGPSIPSLPVPGFGNEPRTRSTSPRYRVASLASSALDGSTTRLSPLSPRTSLPLPARRGSWQPHTGRKSVLELEAEYHDSDDDLPDDASLWNVPLSPHLHKARSFSSRSSLRGSPERDVSTPAPPPIPLSHSVSAPEPPQHYSRNPPRLRHPPPRTSSLGASVYSASNPPSPKSRHAFRNARSKSWNLAMADLSEEAKALCAALEYHAELAERRREEMIQSGTISSRQSLETSSNRSSKSSIVALPPFQRSDLDFMPMSKEKEAILSRTRPTWLPPKDPREEKRHLKEYQRMMARAAAADRKREQKQRTQRIEREETRESLNRIWEQYVCPDWERVISEHRTRELWWKGVSPRVRGKVWSRAVGNSLGLTESSYLAALTRAKDVKAKSTEELKDGEKAMKTWQEDIERDADTAFPELNLFQGSGPLRQDLIDICEAYVAYRSDVGWVYGMHLVAALLLLQVSGSPWEVFVLLANCLNQGTPLAFVTNDGDAKERLYAHVMDALADKAPRLNKYLFGPEYSGGLSLNGEQVLEPMLRTGFTNGLDLERLCRVWDCWVFEGDKMLVRTAVAVLQGLESHIFTFEGDAFHRIRRVVEMLGWGPTGRRNGYWDLDNCGDVDAFMKFVRDSGRRS